MASVLRQRFGALRRHLLPTHLRHPVHPSSAIAKRFMGGHGGDDAEETFKWRNITIAATIGCVGMIFNTFSGEEHHHPEERPSSCKGKVIEAQAHDLRETKQTWESQTRFS